VTVSHLPVPALASVDDASPQVQSTCLQRFALHRPPGGTGHAVGFSLEDRSARHGTVWKNLLPDDRLAVADAAALVAGGKHDAHVPDPGPEAHDTLGPAPESIFPYARNASRALHRPIPSGALPSGSTVYVRSGSLIRPGRSAGRCRTRSARAHLDGRRDERPDERPDGRATTAAGAGSAR
jgi:hypothetical protein